MLAHVVLSFVLVIVCSIAVEYMIQRQLKGYIRKIMTDEDFESFYQLVKKEFHGSGFHPTRRWLRSGVFKWAVVQGLIETTGCRVSSSAATDNTGAVPE